MASIFLTGLSLALSAVGTMASASAARRQADAERTAADYNAMMMERRANEERAVGTRKAAEKRRELEYAQSRLQSRAAASGGSASDPGTISLAADIEQQGEYNALTAIYTGESTARNYETQAGLTRYVGESRARALEDKAKGTLIEGFGGLAGKLGSYALKFG